MLVYKGVAICLLLAGTIVPVAARTPFLPIPPRKALPQKMPDRPLAWSEVDKALAQLLLNQNLGKLAGDAVHKPLPQKDEEQMRTLDLFLRAGYHSQALTLLRRLPTICTEVRGNAWGGALEALYDRHDWELTGALLDRMPRATPSWVSSYITYRLKTESPEAVDRWMQKRAGYQPAYWQWQRLALWSQFGQAGRVLNPLASAVRRHPADITPAMDYLRVARNADAVSVEWMGEVCKPKLAMESFELGQQLAWAAPSAAITLYLRSLATPFTPRDARWFYESRQARAVLGALPAREVSEPQLRDWTKLALAENYQKTGQADKAQPLLEQVSAHNPDAMPTGFSQLAGQTQAASGARVIENRIRAAEVKPENTNSPEYWQMRAGYYAGRRENEQALQAYEKALELIKKNPKSTDSERILMTSETAHFLFVSYNAERTVAWSFQQLETANPGSEYARYVVMDILRYQETTNRPISADDPRLWTFLRAQQKWPWGQMASLLEAMAKATTVGEREAFWKRVENLTENADPSRAFTVAEALWHLHEWERLIPILRGVFPHLSGETERNFARLYLFQAYTETKRWREAREMLESAQRGLSPSYDISSQALLQTAEAAAKAGALPEAFELWKRAVNLDRRATGNLSTLANLGLREQLRDYYRTLQVKEPQYEPSEPVKDFLKGN